MTRFLVALVSLCAVTPVFAQQEANTSQLRLVVVDETGAGIPAATIVVKPASGPAVTFTTDERGLAMSPALPIGNATLHVEFGGFEPFDGTVTLRRGAMNHNVTLKIAGLSEEVLVSDTTATDDRRATRSARRWRNPRSRRSPRIPKSSPRC